jgi:hypothetical protein
MRLEHLGLSQKEELDDREGVAHVHFPVGVHVAVCGRARWKATPNPGLRLL